MADDGKSLRFEFWYNCDICGSLVPQSRTTRKVRTRVHKGYRVCLHCLDAPGTDDYLEHQAQRLQRLSVAEGKVAPP